jgi:hypothetical protein
MFEKEKKYFPKITDPQCQLKWNWSTLWLTEGTTNSCHRCLHVPIDPENFDNFHNLPHKVKEREIMLSGKWPTVENGGSGHCLHCKRVEDSGGISDRMNMLKMPNQSPPELDEDPKATSVTPRILELFMNDTCNMKCTYCGIRDSSQWKSEIKKYGAITDLDGKPMKAFSPTHPLMKKHNNQRMFFEKTLEWLTRNGHKLSRLHLLGGETFYQSELDELLDTLEKTRNKHLELNIVSNFMVKEERFKSIIERIKKLLIDRRIGRLDLTASIDGWGPEAEYARTGLKCDQFEKLFSYAVNQKWMVLHINQTITSMSVKSIPALIRKIKDYRRVNKKISLRAGSVTRPDALHPCTFGRNFWELDLEKILSVWPQEDDTDKSQMIEFKGIFDTIENRDPDKQQVKLFKHFLDQLDKRRNTNWREVFPYLDI